MIIKAYIENYGDTAFNIVSGGVVKENFNETLDSGCINITNLTTQLNLFPTQFVKLESTDGSYSKYFIIDNFVESILNLDEGIYDYVINLASPLKLLEKVQLPNRTIIHSLTGTRKKIASVINEMMTLYCPKIKFANGTNWSYEYIINWTNIVNDTKFTGVDCPDLSFNAPTLREVITTLMLVVGCLPTINHRELACINLRAKATTFNIQEGRIYDIKRSNSIDSYVNTLQVQAQNVLDTNNKVINEMLGFRDRDNVFLKHTENLKLETRFPIESIEKLEIRSYAQVRLNISSKSTVGGIILGIENQNLEPGFALPSAKITYQADLVPKIIKNVSISYYYDANATLDYDNTGSLCLFLQSQPTLLFTDTIGNLVVSTTKLTFEPSDSHIFTFAVITFTSGSTTYQVATPQLGTTIVRGIVVNKLFSHDITDIVFEEGKRKLLSKDFTFNNGTETTYDYFNKYYYTTLSFKYGSNEITGFSNRWTEFQWFGQDNQNFMETLWEAIKEVSEDFTDIENYLYMPSGSITGQRVLKTTQSLINTNMSKYSLFFFNIVYKPFNDINIRYSKEVNEIPYTIEQLDKQEASIPMLDEFSDREIDKINRLGNNVLQIHQSQVSDFSYINALNTLYDDSTIFSREIAFYDDGFEVNYVGTKNYVLKNYFTALQTKYRAYEYVDYDQTVLRKENAKFFVYIGTHYFNGDDNIVYDYITSTNDYTPPMFWSSLLNYTIGEDETMKYQIDGIYDNSIENQYAYYKNDLSVINFKNNIVLSYKAFDSVSNGIYISNPVETTPQEAKYLGGYIQGWYINDNYAYAQMVMFSNVSMQTLYQADKKIVKVSEVESYANSSLAMPRINLSYLLNNVKVLKYKDTNSVRLKTYYKSQNEVLSQTLQFEYYTDTQESGKPYFERTKKFVEINSMCFDRSKGIIRLYGFESKTDIVEEAQSTIDFDRLFTPYSSFVGVINDRGIKFKLSTIFYYANVKYHSNYRTIKVIWYDNETQLYYDIFALQLESDISVVDFSNLYKYNYGTINAYFSLNDTKTEKVYKENSTTGIYEQTEQIAVNTDTRILQ